MYEACRQPRDHSEWRLGDCFDADGIPNQALVFLRDPSPYRALVQALIYVAYNPTPHLPTFPDLVQNMLQSPGSRYS